MAIPLIVLAIGSVVAGFIGIPHALGGSNFVESFLEPSFEVSESARHPQTTVAGATPLEGNAGELRVVAAQGEPAHAPSGTEDDATTEKLLMGLSMGVAFAGIGIAAYFWLRNRSAAEAMAQRFSGLHQLLYHKYYVDEIYDAAVVHPIRLLSTEGLWQGLDVRLVDGAVNGVGLAMRATSDVVRHAQSGSVRTYAASLFLGVTLILGWFLWG
jgi:NADH-quinone oxidoreductase subunit L